MPYGIWYHHREVWSCGPPRGWRGAHREGEEAAPIARAAGPRFRGDGACAGRDATAQYLFERPHMAG